MDQEECAEDNSHTVLYHAHIIIMTKRNLAQTTCQHPQQ
jgi:hypothetical protein